MSDPVGRQLVYFLIFVWSANQKNGSLAVDIYINSLGLSCTTRTREKVNKRKIKNAKWSDQGSNMPENVQLSE